MAKKVRRKKLQAKAAKKRDKKRVAGRGGVEAIYKELKAAVEDPAGKISFSNGDVEVNAAQMRELRKGIARIAPSCREKVVEITLSRGEFKDFRRVNGLAFIEMMHANSIKTTVERARAVLLASMWMSFETKMGGCVQDIASLLPIRANQHWDVLDSNPDLKAELVVSLGENIVKQLDIYGLHHDQDIGGGKKILRLPGVKLNAQTMNASTGAFASISLVESAPIVKLAKACGAERAEVIIGVAFDKSDSQMRGILNKMSETLEPRGWKRFDDLVGHPCLVSPDGGLRFRVLRGKKFWGYMAEPKDISGELDIIGMFTLALRKIPVKRGLRAHCRKLAVSMEDVFKTNAKAFLAHQLYSELADDPWHEQRLMLWGLTMLGSWTLLE